MENFKKLFVAIDFSPASDEALREAHDRAASSGATLAVCHVVPNELRHNVLFPQDTRSAALQFPLEMKKIGEAAAARVSEITGRTEGAYELILDDGTPQAVILSRAEEWLADLIILGSHGQTSAADTLLGSVTDSVVRHAHCPVLIVRPGKRTGHIVAGTDFSDPSLPALRAAANEAERTGKKLIVVHSLDLIWSAASYPAMVFGGAPVDVSPAEVAKLNVTATERLEASLKQLNVSGEAVVTTGSAGTAILEIAAERQADLIVVGTVGRTGLRRALLGSVAETVVSQATCSVLVVRTASGVLG
jgi:nucleotide-binding universal stress UspA family protein